VRPSEVIVCRFKNEDGSCSSAIAAHKCGDDTVLSVGSESGVVSIYKDGLPTAETAHSTSPPSLSRAIMNLTTRVDTLSFHPSGQLLAIGSSEVRSRNTAVVSKMPITAYIIHRKTISCA
jgi:hypothetical protein